MRKVTVTPSPLINRSLARTGYDYREALREFIDNSADAIKKRIATDPDFKKGEIVIYGNNFSLTSDSNEDKALVIIDNGIGVNADEEQDDIAQVWSLGKSHKDGETDELYGVFGIGMKTSAQSLGKFTTFSSRSSTDQEFMTSIYRSDSNSFDIPVCKSSKTDKIEKRAINRHLEDDTGTVIVIRQLSNKIPSTINQVYNSLEEDLARIYRDDLIKKKFVIKLGFRGSKTRVVDHTSVIDPLYHSDETTKFYFDSGPNGKMHEIEWEGYKIGLRVSHTAAHSGAGNSGLGSGIKGSRKRGIYFRRNEREIDIRSNEGENLYWKSMANVSNFFVEVNFKDDGVGSFPIQTDFAKKSILQDPNFVAFMRKYLEHTVNTVKKVNTSTLNKKDQQSADDCAQIFSEMVKAQRLSTTGDKTKTPRTAKKKSSKEKRSSVTRYRGKAEKFVVDTKEGVRSIFKFETVDMYKDRDLPCWMDVGSTPGVFIIYINEANDWIAKLKNDNQLGIVYRVCGALVLSLKETLKSENEIIDFTEFFGQLLNDFTEREKSFYKEDAPKLIVNNS